MLHVMCMHAIGFLGHALACLSLLFPLRLCECSRSGSAKHLHDSFSLMFCICAMAALAGMSAACTVFQAEKGIVVQVVWLPRPAHPSLKKTRRTLSTWPSC